MRPKPDEKHDDDDNVDDDEHSDTENEPFTRTAQHPKVSRHVGRSCCGICGCVTMTICSGILLLMIGLVVFAYFIIATGVQRYTVAAPIDIPIITVPETELNNTFHQIVNYIDGINSVDDIHNISRTDKLIISSRFVNGVIAETDYLHERE